ncbi:DltD domain-containing protein [Colletotrichum truncatum]|uniref:DltD domain-containing protein n=1 Tax=Colletotrichum truncatum TaxID=5467 RepID=A0ACC3YE01_COLTU|nr:DltD domain-containing protein [Colletotrichum truncatum]KAF6790230.1 DltD domain-containing protein [Colletotrichum truncatum]
MTVSGEKLEFKTIDGIVLRGVLYAADKQAPAIIMTHGFNCVKEMLLPELAEWFQHLGFNALIYDPRSIGDSDGLPRNQISPLQQAEDLSDVVTHVAALPNVDSRRIILWGMSFGATVSACAAAVDRRVKAVVMVCPIFSFFQPDKREKAFVQLIRDRQSQLRGNEPFTLPPFNSKGENPIGMAGSGGPGGIEAYTFMNAVIDRGAPNFRDRITLQTYHKLALFRPKELLHLVKAPVQMIIPELDDISPAAEQEEAFGRFGEPKSLYLAKGKGHLTVLSGQGSKEIWQAMIDFIRASIE